MTSRVRIVPPSAAWLRLIGIGWLGCVPVAQAVIEPVTVSPAVTNYTGNFIDADAANPDPGYDRDTLAVQCSAWLTKQNFNFEVVTFQFVFSLRDEANQPVLLDLGGGVTGIERVTSQPVARSAPGDFPVLQTAALKPAATLAVGMRCRVRVDVRRLVGGSWVTLITGTEDAGRDYFHFTHDPATDAPWHVLGGLAAVQVVQPVIIRSQAGQERFTVRATAELRRYDDTDAPPAEASVPVHFTWTLTDEAAAGELALVTAEQTVEVLLVSYQDGAVKAPAVAVTDAVLPVELADWLALNPTHNCHVGVTAQVMEQDGSVANHDRLASVPQPLQALSGKLLVGSAELAFSAISNDPRAGLIASAGGWSGALAVAPGTGSLPQKTGYTFGGPAFNADFATNGDVRLAANANWPEVAGPAEEMLRGVRFQRPTIYLTDAGIVAKEALIWLPAGLSYTVPPAVLPGGASPQLPLIHHGRFRANGLHLAADLTPSLAEVPVSGALVHVAHESMPLVFVTGDLRWRVADGAFRFTPAAAIYTRNSAYSAQEAYVANTQFSPPEAADKPANDGYFRYAIARPGTIVTCLRNPAGGSTIDAGLDFSAGAFAAHFPRGMDVTFGGGAIERNAAGGIDPAGSRLTGVAAVTQTYQQNCTGDGCPGALQAGVLTFTPQTGPSGTPEWQITPVGGLHANGTIASAPLQWGASGGQFAHQTSSFTTAGALIAGHRLAATEPLAGVPDAARAVAMLFTGDGSPATPDLTERPGTPGYAKGFADYPGLNFRCGDDGDFTGTSRLAGKDLGPYQLRGFSKYYVRRGGLSGIHQSVLGSITGTPNFYDFGIALDSLRLSFLDGRNEESKTNGSVRVPSPPVAVAEPGVTPGFDLAFSRLRFTCAGQLEAATLGDTSEKTLGYWGLRFVPHAIRFATPPGGCVPVANPAGFVVLGVAAKMQPLIKQDLVGELTFLPTGNLLTEAAALALPVPLTGVDSRLAMPSGINLRGPGDTSYPLTGCTRAYLNNWELRDDDADPQGFVAFAGTLDVPFFDDIRVHVHAQPGSDLVYLMGGWPANADAGSGQGWHEGTSHFFNTKDFDAENRGYPALPGLAAYRASLTEIYHPITSHRWLDVVDFNYPLKWNPGARSFSMFGAEPFTDVFLFRLANRLKYLSPAGAKITFGTEYTGLPKINLQQLLNNQLDQALNGPFKSLQASLQTSLNDAAKATRITNAARTLDELVSNRADKLINAPIDTAIGTVADGIVEALRPIYARARLLNNNVAADINATLTIEQVLQVKTAVLAAFALEGAVAARIDGDLQQVEDGLTDLIDLVADQPKPNGAVGTERKVLAFFAAQLIHDQGLGGVIGELANDLLNQYVPQYDMALEEIEKGLRELLTAVKEIHRTLNFADGLIQELHDRMEEVFSGAFLGQLRAALATGLDQARDASGKLFDEFGPEAMKRLITGFLREKILASVLPERFMAVLRLRAGSLQGRFQQYLDDLLGQLSSMIRDKLSVPIPELDNRFTAATGKLDYALRGAKMDGFVKIAGESVQHLRVNLDLKLPLGSGVGTAANTGGALDFKGYYEARELETSNPPVGCLVPGRARAEVKVGGNLAPGSAGLGGAAGAGLEARALFTQDPLGSLNLLGLVGSVGLGAGLGIKDTVMPALALQFSVGETGYYLLGTANGTVKEMNANCALFMGTACQVEDLKFLDKDTGRLMKDLGLDPKVDRFTGIYMNAEGTLSINRLLGIPDTRFLSLTAKGGLSEFALYHPVSNRLTLGYRQLSGISGRFAGFVDVGAEMALLGAVGATLPETTPILDQLNNAALDAQGRFKVGADVGVTELAAEFILKAHLSAGGGLSFSAEY